MNREQKGAAVAEIAAEIKASDAIFAVDYRGISVAQVAELRSKLRESETKFKVVKNSLTERAADETGSDALKPLLSGPTALAFVKGDAATAAKAIADYARATQLLPFKGGLMGGETLAVEQMVSLSRLPSREVLYGQLVGVVASPISGLVRTLAALTGGLAVALDQVRQKMESGELPSGAAPAASERVVAEAEADAPAEAESAAEADAPAEADALVEAEPAAEAEPAGDAEPAAEDSEVAKDEVETAAETVAERDDNEADASAGEQPETDTADANKED
jgi:large subunit ribosomal protein L10